jgi:hypothetical protein
MKVAEFMRCERFRWRSFFVFQAWRRRSRICNATHTLISTSTLLKKLCHCTIHTQSSGNLSARAKCFSTIPIRKGGSTRPKVPCRATIHIQNRGSLSDPTSCCQTTTIAIYGRQFQKRSGDPGWFLRRRQTIMLPSAIRRPGRPAPTIGPGTAVMETSTTSI